MSKHICLCVWNKAEQMCNWNVFSAAVPCSDQKNHKILLFPSWRIFTAICRANCLGSSRLSTLMTSLCGSHYQIPVIFIFSHGSSVERKQACSSHQPILLLIITIITAAHFEALQTYTNDDNYSGKKKTFINRFLWPPALCRCCIGGPNCQHIVHSEKLLLMKHSRHENVPNSSKKFHLRPCGSPWCC